MSEALNHEYLITEYAIKHNEEIIKLVCELATDAKDNPILHSHFREALQDELIQHFANALGLSYEDVACIVEADFIKKYIEVKC